VLVMVRPPRTGLFSRARALDSGYLGGTATVP
jgi:hypothetical protein